MNRDKLISLIQERQSYLCIGLDPDLEKIPAHLLTENDPIFTFNKQIIDSTRDLCVAYKPNLAFYEAQGVNGWKSFQKTVDYIGDSHFIIADAKRGDIGNTSDQYAQAFFIKMNCDAITVAPYMGKDSIDPFLRYPGKWAIILALTSNSGSKDFQYIEDEGLPLFETVIKKSKLWGSPENTMYVVGATHPEELRQIREMIPDHFLLVPGVGAQGGSLEDVSKNTLTSDFGLLVNVSRTVIYAGNDHNFAGKSRQAARNIQQAMTRFLSSKSGKK